MKKLRKKCTLLWLLFIFLGLRFSAVAQSNHHLLNPTFFDQFSSAQIVSDSLIRVFGLSYQRDELVGGSAFIGDYTIIGDQLLVASKYIGENECYFNGGITELPILPLADGGTIVGFNPFDCDYWPPGGLVKLNREDSLDWILDFRELDLWLPVDQIIFVDSNVIAVVGENYGYADTLFINRSGQLISNTTFSIDYDITIETPFGFLAGAHDRLDVLNTGFEVMTSFDVGPITHIQLIGNKVYLIKTDTKYYHYDQDGLLMVWPLSPSTYSSVWASPTYFWGYSGLLKSVVRFDTLFGPVDTFSVPRGFSPLTGMASDSTLLVAGQYSNGLNSGIATIKFSESNPHFRFPGDIGVTLVEVADTILVDYVNEPFWGSGWYQHYDYINVEVTNFGIDTVDGYWIESKTTSECGFCYYYNPRWWIDTLPIPPGEKVWVALGAHLAECTWETPVSICMTTYAPDQVADDNIENDSACDTYSFIVGATRLSRSLDISVQPNPANDVLYIYFDPEEVGRLNGTFFNAVGQMIDRLSFADAYTALDVSDWPSGIYFLVIADESGKYGLKQFIVAH